MRSITVFAWTAATAAAIVSSAHAQPVIDDFETGTFHIVAQADEYVVAYQTVSAPAHSMASTREVGLLSFAGVGLPAYADLDAWTMVDDKSRIRFGPDGGFVQFTYEPSSPVDLTSGGLNDRIEVSFAASTVGGSVSVQLGDGSGANASYTQPTSAGAREFPFTGYTGVDVTAITKVRVLLSNPGYSAYDLRDIRAMRNESIWQRFQIATEILVGPPFPLPPYLYTVLDMTPSDYLRVQLLAATKLATGAQVGLALTGMDSGDDMEPGYAAAVHTAWNEAGTMFESTAFDFEVGVAPVSGADPVPFLPSLPAVTATPTGFLLSFDVHYRGAGGEIVRTSRRQMMFDAFPGQAIALAEARVLPPQAGLVETNGFRVTFIASEEGDVDPGEPLFEASITADCEASATTGVPSHETAAVAPLLEARPTVTRSGTTLALSRPAAAESRIDLFGVTGRLVRRLEIPPGAAVCRWDGLDASGRPAAAGVYIARFVDGAVSAGARIVRVP